ncbi:MAG: prephenate dehydrogenase/arogenate dehydrogenase family protein [Chitinispirillales bacterium]|jgi:prephenate dehydrogenase|nr:prephenate dehydrogenase/arogenate dehydrogenase family protein [Chitinispirillales bacterium]
MKIKKIAIYSVGLLGASIGSAMKASGFDGEIVGISSQKNIDDAISIKAIDYGVDYSETQKILETADLLFLCAPIEVIIETIKKISKMNLKSEMIITDIGSTKNEIVETAQKFLPKSVRFVGGHPMAGSEKNGAKFADPFLFQNAVWVLYSQNKSDADELGIFLEKYTGCKTKFINPEIHDKIAAVISHIPHIIAVGLVNTAEKVNQKINTTFDLAAGGFKSLTRIASSPYKMWRDIYKTNKKANIEILNLFIAEMVELRKKLKNDSLETSFENAVKTRAKLSENQKGFVHNLYRIIVIAEDKPGFLAKILTILAQNNLNVNDIELLKVREGDAGSFMFAFIEKADSEKAINLLSSAGFSAKVD